MLCLAFAGIWTVEYAMVFVLDQALEWHFSIHVGVQGWTATTIVLGRELFNRIPPKGVASLSQATLEIYLLQVTFTSVRNIGQFPVDAIPVLNICPIRRNDIASGENK